MGEISDREFTEKLYDKLEELTFLDQCMKEITRMYFTVMLPPRKVLKPFKVQTMTIREGSYLCISPIVAHHDSNIFPQHEQFFPRRFAPRHGKTPFGKSYVQFGYGRHRCTGEKYATTVIGSLTSLLLRKYELRFQEGESLPPPVFSKAIGTAQPSKPIILQVLPRGDVQ